MHGCTKFNHRPNKEQYRIVRYNMTGRLMYIPKEIASNFGHAETLEADLNTVKGRISNFSTVSILKILSQLMPPKTVWITCITMDKDLSHYVLLVHL